MSVLRIAVPCPLFRVFDYLPPEGVDPASLSPGIRVQVEFGRRRLTGVLLETVTESDVPANKLRRARSILDTAPLLDATLMQLARWTARYYHHPLGEVTDMLLPAPLRQGKPLPPPGQPGWRLSVAGRQIEDGALRRAKRQLAVWERLADSPEGLASGALANLPGDWRGALRALQDKGLVEPCRLPDSKPVPGESPNLNPAQAEAAEQIHAAGNSFRAFLLDGVTGSGKTEVYIDVLREVIASGRQALVLVPEIGLTPQLVSRFARGLGVRPAVLHSGLADGERLAAWSRAWHGEAPLVIGTRSAVWAPLPRLGMIVVDEEHDGSFKQQDGCRYSARDVAVMRAQRAGIPIILGSATPSLESVHNAKQRRYTHLHLPERARNARPPAMRVADLRGRQLFDGLSQPLLDAVDRHLAADGQVLLFLNRRGYAPTLICHACGWTAQCRRCDARMTYHRGRQRLACHHCGAEAGVPGRCPDCASLDLMVLGKGTERLEAALEERYGGVGVARIDRDTTSRRGSLQRLLSAAAEGKYRILIGTQMLAKGHDFPRLTLVGVVDTDQGLFNPDFRAPERMAQLVTQVAGRAGRADKPGEVILQTHQPEHPLLQQLIHADYAAFCAEALAERKMASLPPFASLAMLRAEAADEAAPQRFLQAAAENLRTLDERIMVLGPAPAPMPRRAGRYRAQLLLQSSQRARLQALLDTWVPTLGELPEARRVRWSIDVDPQDMG